MARKKKDKEIIDVDFSELALKVLNFVVDNVSPVSFCELNIFNSLYYLSAIEGKDKFVCACSLTNPNIRGKTKLNISLVNPKTKEEYTFTYNVPFTKIKNSKICYLCGYVQVADHSIRDDNFFSIKVNGVKKYNNFIVDIRKRNIIGTVVETRKIDDSGQFKTLYEGEGDSTTVVYSTLKQFKAPELDRLKFFVNKFI